MHSTISLKSLTLLSTLLTTSLTHAAYTLKDDYTPSTFFSKFTFFTDDDPTHGFVDYQSQSAAQSANLINTNNNQIYMGVDSTSTATGRGRKSVRITSNAVYNHALIILDLDHMPGSICGVWPAFWTVGPNWPTAGEIDIIEGVNGQVGNSVALHTGPGCSVGGGSGGGTSGSSNTSPNNGAAQAIFSGTLKTPNCDVAASGQATNAGCAITSSDASTYGSGLNSANGGVYATEWTSNAISVWFFPRGSIPSDIDSGSPTPSSWGAPIASFGGGSCNIDDSFKNQQIVFDTTFCGDWAGSVWSTDSTCSSKASTCQDYVANNPAAFKDAYWAVNHLKVYTGDDSGAAPSGSASASVSVPVSSGPPISGTGVPSIIPPVGSTSASSSGIGISPTKSRTIGPAPTGGQSTIAPQPTVGPTPTMSMSMSMSGVPGSSSNVNPNPNPAPTPIPTTLATSSRGGNNGNPNYSNTWSWGGGNGYTNTWTRTRNWGGPPRMAKFAAAIAGAGGDLAVPSMPRVTGTDGPGDVGPHVAFESEREGSGEGGVRSLIHPVVRRDVNVNVNVNVEERDAHLNLDARRVHLGRHKERRYGHGHV